jgi:tetratricopeptide (TPR) repeat protein
MAVCAFGQQPDPRLAEAIRLHQSGDVGSALPLYREYLKAHPESVDGLANFGAALAHEGLFDEAITQYGKALAVQPDNPQVLLNLALSFYKTGRYADAKEKFERVMPRMQPFSPPHRQISFLLADCEIRLGQYRAAVALLDPWEQKTPDDMALAYLLGTALLKDKQAERGAAVIDRILRKGDSAESRLLIGTAKLNSLDFTGARDELQKAAELNPKLPEVHGSLGLALLGLSQSDAAAAEFRRELEVDPNNFAAVFQLGILAKQDQRYPEARQYLTRSLSLRPGDPAVLYQFATVDVASGRLEEGRRELEELIRQSPDFTEAHVSLAGVYYKLKRKEDGDRERAIVRRLTAQTQASQPAAK